MAKQSTRQVWEDFWDPARSVEDIYPTSTSIVENLLAVADVRGKKILEVGAGTGRDSVKLSRLGAEVTVLDYSDNALSKVKEAARLNDASLQFVKADATQLPFPAESFDIVFHQGLMEHFRDELPLFSDNARILKKGGLLLVDVPQTFHVYTIMKKILIAMDKWFAGWEKQYTIGQLRRMYRDHGMEIVHEYGDYMVPSLFYRVMREAGKKLGLRLPMYPGALPVFGTIRRSAKSFIKNHPVFLNTYLTIGVIGRKT